MFQWFKNKFFKNKNNDKYQLGLKKTKANFVDFFHLLKQTKNIQQSLLQSLENLLIQADVGTKTTLFLMQTIKDILSQQALKEAQQLPHIIMEKMLSLYCQPSNNNLPNQDFLNNCQVFPKSLPNTPQIYLFIGVNGVGKTTTIGKMAAKLKQEGKKTLLIAGDTFRAGAVEQLTIWGNQTQTPVFSKNPPSNPASVIFEGIQLAKQNNYDIILCDTAGRLQNKNNLMQELARINRVVNKHLPKVNLKAFLVLDATTGQNVLNQVQLFNEVTPLTGAILTKLDGTSKGGIVLAIKHLHNLTTNYIGVGEKAEDLIEFDIKNYLFHLFEDFFPSSTSST